jgi:hypothetical protein
VKDTTMADISADPAVLAWLASMTEMWGSPPDERTAAAYLTVLGRFSDEIGQTPSEMIEACTARHEDGRPITTVKGINRYWKLIEARRAEWGQDSSRYLLSFFIHNGVLMQSPV